MSQQRGTITDWLNNVIQVIQLGKKTGLLWVERGENSKREEGAMAFVRGQVVEAQTGQLQGQLAFNRLITWEMCRFIFVPGENERTIGAISELSPLAVKPHLQDTNSRLRAYPSQGSEWKTTTGSYNAVPIPPGPRRIRPANEGLHILERTGLSRSHRHLFLLIDGQRSVQELVRLVGRSSEEVQRLLQDLEGIGIIQK